jgi:serine/threonine protein kinase
MIMERCDQTLKSKFLDSDYDNPAKVGSIHSLQIKQMGELARYALQICSGLGYLHKKELVHRDIKLENILVNRYLLYYYLMLQQFWWPIHSDLPRRPLISLKVYDSLISNLLEVSFYLS